ncbi:MAG: nitronate monooxygenase [Bryobacteraceae bacterium]
MPRLQELLDLPIIQAPMAGVQSSALAIGVSTAGGLGSLPCAMLTPAQIRAEIAAIQVQTSRPYNLNFFCHTPPVPDLAHEARWRAALAPYYEEFGIDPAAIAPAPARSPFSAETADIVEEFRPPVVSFHFGLPEPDLFARVKWSGAVVLSSATTVEEALWLEARGADAIIAQGLEAGGHRGMFLSSDLTTQTGTFALVPQVARAVRVPVIAAGGIADAAGVRAALALGASAVQVGTAFLLCPETTTSPIHRAALRSDAARHTALTRLFSGRPARGIVNRIIRELGPMSDIAPAFPLATAALAPLRTAAERRGDSSFSALWCGENASGCREIPAGELTRLLAQGL